MSFLVEQYVFRAGCCEIEPCTTNQTSQAKVRGPCYFCKQPQEVAVWPDDLQKFREGVFAQNCFHYLSPADREFLISGICGECWDKMFGEESEDDDADED